MLALLTRAAAFVAIIILGIVLRRVGLFKTDDFRVLSNIVLKITLPAAIITSFSQNEIHISMLLIALLGLGCGGIYMLMGFLLNLKNSKAQRAFEILNYPGYNIGNFALPFTQSFLGPVGVVTTCLFDTGNAFVCLGGAYSVASMVKDGSGFSWKRILKALSRSVPFLCYLIMVPLNLLNLRLPDVVLECAGIISGANGFLAMLTIGVGFHLSGDRSLIGRILKILLVRYGLATVFALAFYFLLPYSLETRQTLVILAFSPIGSAVPMFTRQLDVDVGLSSAVNSLSIVISVIIIVALLSIMQG